ncbi:hypothetical protein HDU67_007482 [Dinochytrium kinnereticum]|nr:hypothetical protein HDU67_007482 [Dinochytrium kinnereticum]
MKNSSERNEAPSTYKSSLYFMALLREADELNTQIACFTSESKMNAALLKHEIALYDGLEGKAAALRRVNEYLTNDLVRYGEFQSNREQLGRSSSHSKIPLELDHHR